MNLTNGEAAQLLYREWQREALARAAKRTGEPEGALALVESRRYGLLADRIEELEAVVAGLLAHRGEAA